MLVEEMDKKDDILNFRNFTNYIECKYSNFWNIQRKGKLEWTKRSKAPLKWVSQLYILS